MATPIIVLAGQSNARALRDGVVAALTAQYGAGGFVLVEVAAAGAPLTYKRSDADWYASDELRAELQAGVSGALRDTSDGVVEGIVWVQGEGDTHDIARAGDYGAHLTALMDGLRDGIAAEFAGRETGIGSARLAISALSDVAPDGAGRDNWSVVMAEQAAVAAADGRAVLVDPDLIAQAQGMTGAAMWLDGLHYAMDLRPHLARALVEAATGGAAQGGPPPLVGTDGNDRMVGTPGGDRLIGGRGDDTYIVDHAGDRVVELNTQGRDTVVTDRSFSLRFHSQYIEDLVLTGSGDVDGTGNRLDNRITGNSGNNRLEGAWGDDVLLGGAGNDRLVDSAGRNRMVGGTGDDTYEIVHRGNRIVEREGEGEDTVVASITFSLRKAAWVERLVLAGDAAIDGTGNGLDNALRGNSAANRLNGGWGDDRIDGGGGDDRIIGHRGDDVLTGGAGHDVFLFRAGEGADRITDFTPGEDRIGHEGAATLAQQGGDTLILFQGGGSVLLEGVDVSGLTADSLFLL
ncbi:MAG: hypothetical protein KDK24_19185 [Pseudooceanicola sp.]|nr:hypothetical protein [Pseudooceanicola sp.]